MKKSSLNKAFILGVGSCFFLFVSLNYCSYIISYNEWEKEPGYIVGRYELGFPFAAHYKSIGYPSELDILWSGFLANILTACVCSLVVGLIFQFIFGLKSPRESKRRRFL